MEISVEELASLLRLTVAQTPSTKPERPDDGSHVTRPTRYNLVYGEVFREIAPLFGNPGPSTERWGKLVSKVHELTKERLHS